MRTFVRSLLSRVASACCVVGIVVPSFAMAQSNQATPQQIQAMRNAHAPNQLVMPLVGADQGRAFQTQRVVPPSDAPPLPRRGVAAGAAPSPFANVAGGAVADRPAGLSLGHPLPTTAMSPLGTPRADFAIAKTPPARKAAKPNAATGVTTTVIH